MPNKNVLIAGWYECGVEEQKEWQRQDIIQEEEERRWENDANH
jgi:hypothetical protein